MLQSIRTITTNLTNILKPSPSTWTQPHFRLLTTTSPQARKPSPQYPNEQIRIARYAHQAIYHRTRYHTSPLYHSAKETRRLKRYATLKNDQTFILSRNLHNWTRKHEWVRHDLPWKTYAPVLGECRIKHYCQGCDWVRGDGLLLWWRRRRGVEDKVARDGGSAEVEKSDDYLCHSCYVSKRSRFEVLPEGYEDIKTFKDIVARKKQLDELAAA
jgi:hypothetical protein